MKHAHERLEHSFLADAAPQRDNLAAIIVAGGRSARMGGIDKSTISLNGVRLIDHLLAGLQSLGIAQDNIVIVSTKTLAENIAHTAESPAFGGPLAGISAGLQAIPASSSRVAIFSVDAPDSWKLLPQLANTLANNAERDAAIIKDDAGIANPLCSVWKTAQLSSALTEIGDPHDKPARALVRHSDWVGVDGTGLETDYDTLAELKARGAVELPANSQE